LKESDKRILEAATRLFSEKGYNGVSTKEIASEAGVNEITIFRNFGTKAKLLQAVIRDFAVEGNIIEKVADDITDDIRKDLFIFADDYYMFLKNNIVMYKIQIKEINEDGARFTNSITYKEFIYYYLTAKKDEGIFNGDPNYVATLLVTSIMGMFTYEVFSSNIYDGYSYDELIKTFIEDIIEKYVN